MQSGNLSKHLLTLYILLASICLPSCSSKNNFASLKKQKNQKLLSNTKQEQKSKKQTKSSVQSKQKQNKPKSKKKEKPVIELQPRNDPSSWVNAKRGQGISLLEKIPSGVAFKDTVITQPDIQARYQHIQKIYQALYQMGTSTNVKENESQSVSKRRFTVKHTNNQGLGFHIKSSSFQPQEEYLARLHQQRQANHSINCSHYDLRNADLSKLDLRGINFSEAQLKGADFSHANLQGANFTDAQLQKAKFCYSNLANADFTRANINGGQFKGAHLLNINYPAISSSKGTLFDDKKQLSKKLKADKAIDLIKKKFFIQDQQSLIVLKASTTLKEIHDCLHTRLNQLLKNSSRYIIVDFRRLDAPNQPFQACSSFLRASFFKPFVKEIVPINANQGLIVFLNTANQTLSEPSVFYRLSNRNTLDLHGKIPLKVKYKWINQLIKEAYNHQYTTVEIITGRGLNNPSGKMGILWRLCRKYLLSGEFKNYIQEIHTTSKNGAWKIILKDAKQ